MKLKTNAVIDVRETLGELKFLDCKEKVVYENGALVPNKFQYDIELLSSKQKSSIIIKGFERSLDLEYLTSVEPVGNVEMRTSVVGTGDFRSVDVTFIFKDLKVKGENSKPNLMPNTDKK